MKGQTMHKTLFSATALLLLSASYAPAAITGQDIAAQYQSAGYTTVEVKVGPTQAKVEAIKDGIKLETVYDLATGEVLKSETETVDADEDVSPKVEVRNTDDDFTKDDSDDDGDDEDDDDDDDNSGSGSGDDDGDDGDDHDDDHDSDHDGDGGGDGEGHGGDDD